MMCDFSARNESCLTCNLHVLVPPGIEKGARNHHEGSCEFRPYVLHEFDTSMLGSYAFVIGPFHDENLLRRGVEI